MKWAFIVLFLLGGVWKGAEAKPNPAYDVTSLFSKAELEEVLGTQLKEPKIDTADRSVIRYYAVNGTPYLEAVIVSAIPYDSHDYDFRLKNAHQSNEFKQDVDGIGDKGFWRENNVYGELDVVKGGMLVSISVSQSKAPATKLETAIRLAKTAIQRLSQ